VDTGSTPAINPLMLEGTGQPVLEVVTFHLPRYKNTVKTCKTIPGQVNPSNLTFATKFVAMYLFIKVKGSRPMTYQYFTVDMVRTAKANWGFIDQKKFKTASKYELVSLILTMQACRCSIATSIL